MNRSKIIIKTSLIGIAINAVLVGIKVILGLATGSIAIILDAVNNFSDALSAIITIIGTRLAHRAPDKKHPYGYGRIEYITTVVIAFIILIAGGTAVKESFEAIINKDKASYTLVSLIILIVAAIIKFYVAFYTKKQGEKVDSHSLLAAGQEAFFDGVRSTGTLFAAVASLVFGLSLEGFLGIIIGIGIIKNGAEMIAETLGSLIGARADRDLSLTLKRRVANYPGVLGVYDVILHNYGPSTHIGSIHIEVDEAMNAKDIHILSRKIVREIYKEMEIILTVGIYSSINSDPVAVALRSEISKIAHSYPDVQQIHGFFLSNNLVGFDIVIDFKANAPKIISEIEDKLKSLHPEYEYYILLDLDFSD